MTEEKYERQHLADVNQVIETSINNLQAEYQKAQTETSSVEKNYGQNTKINTFEIDDAMETNAEVQQQKQLVEKNLLSERILEKQLTQLDLLKDSAYFGRIDILEDGETTDETLYIGTSSLSDETGDFLVYDWRAPISSIYYNGTLGEVSYQTPGGIQKADLKKKRQFNIKNGELISMFDTNETIGDAILQEALGHESSSYMQNIVATIQQEQNAIIRDTKSDLLLVQGVAGSGKTSAILQRIAYLLYHSRSELSAEQIVLFSPNLLFSNYISRVLPSLGEKNMRQVTLAEFLAQRLQGLKVETLFEEYERGKAESQVIKGTAEMFKAVAEYVNSLQPADLHFTDLTLDGVTYFSTEQIQELFSQSSTALPLSQRFAQTRNLLIKQLNELIKAETKADWVYQAIENLTDGQYYELLDGKQRGRFQEVAAEEDYLARKIVAKKLEPLYDALYNNFFLDIYAQYQDYLQQFGAKLAQTFGTDLEYHQIRLEDTALVLYLRDLLTGTGQNHSIAHLFIDEMQDYSEAQLMYLKHAFPNAKLTILGDSQQALFNDFENPDHLLHRLQTAFASKNAKIIKLQKSYRSTQEITEFTKGLLPAGEEIVSFARHGEKPTIIRAPDEKAALEALKDTLRSTKTNLNKVAIITRDLEESKQLYRQLRSSFPVTLLKNNDRLLPDGISILPIYLAKGLEFDQVIVPNVTSKNYQDAASLGILYTICSRAMHKLTLVNYEKLPAMIEKIAPTLATVETL